jgi:hypothetical protein
MYFLEESQMKRIVGITHSFNMSKVYYRNRIDKEFDNKIYEWQDFEEDLERSIDNSKGK